MASTTSFVCMKREKLYFNDDSEGDSIETLRKIYILQQFAIHHIEINYSEFPFSHIRAVRTRKKVHLKLS